MYPIEAAWWFEPHQPGAVRAMTDLLVLALAIVGLVTLVGVQSC